LSILEACREQNPSIRIVYASTRQIYGHPDYLPVDEHHPIRPVDVNGIHKVAGEWYHLLYDRVYGVPATALRLTNTYGPHMRVKDARQTFLGIWIAKATDADSGRVYNLGGAEVVSLEKLAQLLVQAAGSGSYVIREFPVERKRIDIGDYYAEDALIESALGWSPRVALEEGLRRTVAYYRAHLDAYL
jgi:UDP-glucose 4-epimerase